MSYQVGLNTMRLQPVQRLAHTEYCSSESLVRAVTGLNPAQDGRAWRRFHDAWQFDFLWLTNDGPVPWSERGRTTDMGHGVFLEDGRDKRAARPCPFASVADVWEFDAVMEYGLPGLDELVAYYRRRHEEVQAANPEQLCSGGYYKTLISGAIETLGWEMLLSAAADQRRFEKLLDSIFRLSLRHYEAWAKTSIEVFVCHDDMVWAEGPFMHPDFYRAVVFPRYRELWRVLKAAGKVVLYCSDGDYTQFLHDLAEAGAQGFVFEPVMDLEAVVSDFGGTHVIVGSKVDCRTLTFGDEDRIRAEVDATLELALDCPGFIFAVGNHIPGNVPVGNAMFYFRYLSENWRR